MKKVLLGEEIILPIWYTLKDPPTHFLKVISSWVKHRPILTFEMILSDNNARGLFFSPRCSLRGGTVSEKLTLNLT